MVDDPLPGAAIEVGLKLAEAPEGKPDALNEIAELKLPEIAVVIVLVPDDPCVTVTDVGEADMLNDPVPPPQLGNLNVPTCVLQLNAPLALRYSVVYQKVQSSAGSTLIEL